MIAPLINSTLLVMAVCGKRMYPEPRIVGGSKASFGRWPWQISLRQWRTSTYLHKCGAGECLIRRIFREGFSLTEVGFAALLNENWSITAAHCVDGIPPSDLLLRLGEYDLAEEEEPFMYQERRVQIVASHPQFDPRTFEYDLALLRFYEPVVFQPNIIPVCVPESDENFIGRTAFVTGWGRLYEGKSPSGQPLQTTILTSKQPNEVNASAATNMTKEWREREREKYGEINLAANGLLKKKNEY